MDSGISSQYSAAKEDIPKESAAFSGSQCILFAAGFDFYPKGYFYG